MYSIGSSNFSERSFGLDSELNFYVLTNSESLKKRVTAERAGLLEHSRVLNKEQVASEPFVANRGWFERMQNSVLFRLMSRYL